MTWLVFLFGGWGQLVELGHGMHVLVATTGQVHQYGFVLRQRSGELRGIDQQPRADAFVEAMFASASVTDTYCARLESFSQACSGPTPG